MMRAWVPERVRRDEGLSVLEVVIAAAILFFVLTAMVGLVGASTKMTVASKQRTILNDAVAGHLEYVRSLPFDRVALTSVDPSGGVEPSMTVTVDGFNVTLWTAVSLDTPFTTKRIVVDAACYAPGYRVMRSSATASVRDKDTGITALNESGIGPRIRFVDPTPPSGAVIYGARRTNPVTDLIVAARAESTDSHIVRMWYEVSTVNLGLDGLDGSTLLRESPDPSANPADFPRDGETWGEPQSVERQFFWNTLQRHRIEATGSVPATEVATVVDGLRLVRVYCEDGLGRRAYKDRFFLVDNYAPAPPTGISGVLMYDGQAQKPQITWTPAMDGTNQAVQYRTQIYQWVPDGFGGITRSAPTQYGPLTSPTFVWPTGATPFSWFSADVAAGSSTGRWSSATDMSNSIITRPVVEGTSTCVFTGVGNGRKATVKVRLRMTKPTFPLDPGYTPVYVIERGPSATTTVGFAAVPTGTITRRDVAGDPEYVWDINQSILEVVGNRPPTQYWYRVSVLCQPVSASPRTDVSNICGPSATSNAATQIMGWTSWAQ